MQFKSQIGLSFTGRAATAVKQWPLGWRVGDATLLVSSHNSQGDKSRRNSLGAYGFLVGMDRR